MSESSPPPPQVAHPTLMRAAGRSRSHSFSSADGNSSDARAFCISCLPSHSLFLSVTNSIAEILLAVLVRFWISVGL